MLGLRTDPVEHVAVPVEIAQIDILVRIRRIRDDPRPLRVLDDVVAALLEHFHLFVRIRPRAISLQVGIELVAEGHIIIGRGHEVRPRRVVGDAVPAVVIDAELAFLAALGGDEDDARRTLRTVNGRRRGVLQDGDALDVIGVELDERALDAVHQHQRRTAVQRQGAADGDAVVLRLDRTAVGRDQDGRDAARDPCRR